MIITYEKRLKDFNFGPQARANAELLTDEELNMVENTIMEINNGHIDETELNDLFRFDFKTICEWIGTTEEEVDKRVKTKYISQDSADRMLAILQKAKEICPEIIFKIIESGEGDVIYKGTNPKKAVMEMDGIDSEFGVNCYAGDGSYLGWFFFTPYEEEDCVLCDMSDNDFCKECENA